MSAEPVNDHNRPTLAGAVVQAGTVMVCLARCWECMCAQCPGGEHRWADQDDIDHAVIIGKPESAEGICGCHCTKGPVLDEPEPPDIEEVSIDGPPCHLCGAAGACGYDPEGRPYIHASWDEDEVESV